MTLPTGRPPIKNSGSRPLDAFTLIELILVMMLLLMVFGLSLPLLKGFFRGQDLSSEARRFVSLARYGQNRAVSEGVPMVLWIDARHGTYGLQQQAGYTDGDTNAVRFSLADNLSVEISSPPTSIPSFRPGQMAPDIGNVPMIRFTPDGFIGESSPDRVAIRQGSDQVIWIVENTNRSNYAIETNNYAPLASR